MLAIETDPATGVSYVVCDYVEGRDLRAALPALSREKAFAVLGDVLLGLFAMHSLELAHGDLKPENVIVTPSGRGVLIDPAFADPERARHGTLQYLAPERLLSAAPTAASDLYAFGSLLVEVVLGEPLFFVPPSTDGSDATSLVRAILAGVPADVARRVAERCSAPFLEELLLRLLAPDPALRTLDARAVHRRLLGTGDVDATSTKENWRVVLARTSEERLARWLGGVASGIEDSSESPRTLVIGGRLGSGRTTHLLRLRELARARGILTLDLAEVDSPLRAIAEIANAREKMPGVIAILDDVENASRSAIEALAVFAAALARGEVAGGIALGGDVDAARLALPVDFVVEFDEFMIQPIAESDVLAILEVTIPRLLAPEALAAELVRRSDGSPRRMRSIVRELARRGGLLDRESGIVADLARLDDAEHAAVIEDSAVDSRGRNSFTAYLDELPSESRSVFVLLAQVRVSLPIPVLVEATGLFGPAVLAMLARATRLLVLRGFKPPHETGVLDSAIAVTLASKVASPNDAQAARAIARALLRRSRDATTLASVAQSLAFAGRKAPRHYALASARAALVEVNPTLALRALSMLDGEPMRPERAYVRESLRARALAMAGRLVEAETSFSQAEQLPPDGTQFQLAVEHAQLLERMGRATDAVDRLDRALLRARGNDVFRLRAARAWAANAAGKTAEARNEVNALWSLRQGIDDLSARLEIAAVAGPLADRAGDVRRTHEAFVEARRLSRRLGRLARAAHFDSTLAVIDLEAGRAALAERRLRRAVNLLERSSDRRLLPDVLTRLGLARLESGDARRAFQSLQRATILFSRAGNRRGLGWALAGEGAARLFLGDPEAAVKCLEQSLEHRKFVNAHPGAALSAAELIRARATLGDIDGTRAAVRESLQLSAGPERASARLSVLIAIAEAARDRGEIATAWGVARRAVLLADRAGGQGERATAESLVAEQQLFRSDPIGALRRARLARRLARAAGRRKALAEATGIRAAALVLLRRDAARCALLSALETASDDATKAAVLIAFARAVRLDLANGSFEFARDGRDAARAAQRHALACGHRLRIAIARELVAALDAALEGTAVERDLLRENRQLRQVLEASRWINEADSVADVLTRILDTALDLLGASRGFVVTRFESSFRFEAARNLRQQDIEDPAMQLSRSIVERTLASGETIVTSEARTDERFKEYQSISRLDLLSVLCAPLKARGEVIGAIYVDDPERIDRFDDSARNVTQALAEQAAIVLDRARLRGEIEVLNTRLLADVKARTRELETARDDLDRVRRELEAKGVASPLVTQDPRLLGILDLVERVADSDASVLVLGEAGTGKELIARSLHDRSYRRRKRFIAVNCASLPETLVEAELFGYRKGSFTGATRDHEGLVVAADQGTLFLDEIADMPLAMQAKLLRVLQDGEVWPLGSNKPQRVNFRLVAATNRPLVEWVAAGRFREDLYWRLRVIPIDVPPLRDRRGDVPLLVAHFSSEIARRSGDKPRGFTDAALAHLSAQPFPGNVRELEAVVRALVLTSPHDPIDAQDLPPDYRRTPLPAVVAPVRESALPGETSLKDAVANYEKELVVAALRASEGNRGKAAERLGITRRWLQTLISKYGIE